MSARSPTQPATRHCTLNSDMNCLTQLDTSIEAPRPTSAATPFTVNVITAANLRAAPGTEHAILSAARPGELLTIVAANSASDWLQLADGSWIAATLVLHRRRLLSPSPATLVSVAPATVPSQRKASVPTDVPGALSDAEAAYLQRVAEPMEWLVSYALDGLGQGRQACSETTRI